MMVATRLMSASTAARNSGSSSMRRRPSRSNASFWTTCTTGVGKYWRMSLIQRATLGTEEPRPPRFFFSSLSPSP
jgi:hypothetical protein